MKVLRSLVLFSFVIGLTAAALAVPQSDSDFRWQGRSGAGKTLEIKGVNGEVRAEGSSGDEVEVVAVKRSTWKQGDAAAPPNQGVSSNCVYNGFQVRAPRWVRLHLAG